MTNDEKIALSKQVARLYGIEEYTLPDWIDLPRSEDRIFLADDSARCFEMAVEYKIDIERYYGTFEGVRAYVPFTAEESENYIKHPTKAKATRIAILKCLIKLKEG